MASSLDIALNPDVVCSALDSGGVLLDLETKQYFALNATGLLIWQHLEDGGTLSGLLQARIRAARPDPAGAADIEAFARSLVANGLAIEGGGDSRDSGAPSDQPAYPEPWAAPTVTPHGRPLSQVILSPFDPTVPIPE